MEHFTIKNPDSSKITVHYYNLNSWSNPYIYYYTNTEQPVAWPGVAMTSDGNGWYSYDIYGFEEVKVIFSNNETNQVPAQNQPGYTVTDEKWFLNGTQYNSEPDGITVHYQDYNNWGNVNIYYYNGNLTQEIECEDKPQVTDVSVSFKGSGNINSTTTVTSIYNIDMLSTNLVGLVGSPVEIETESSFDEAVIKFKLDKTKLGNVEFENLGILWYDEENDLFKMQETTLDEANGIVSATVTHFSKYMVVDKAAWFDVWRQEMVYSLSTTNIRTVLAIDCSGSMATNDPKFYYTDGNSIHTSDMTYRRMAADNFINSMTDSAKSSIVTFSGSANVVVPMTNDIIALKAGLSSIYSSGGTNFTNAIQTSLTQFENDGSDYTNKIIMLLTDGKSSVSNSILQSAVDEGVKIYTIGIGQNIQKNVLQNIADYTGGECYIAKTADEIVNIYSTIGLNQNIDMTDSDGDGLADTFETAGMRLSNGEIIYTDPLNADTDGDGLKDGEEIIPQFKFVDSSSIGLSGFSFGIYFKMNSDPTMSDSDGDRIGDKIDENKLTKNIYDYGAIIYDEKVYPIYIPDYTKEHIIASDWKIDFNSSSSKNMWNFMDFISGCTIGISLDDNTDLKDSCIYAGPVMVTNKYRSRNIDCRYGTIFSVIEGVNTAIQNVYDNVKIHVSLLSSKSSGRQAIIEAGTYKRSAVYEEYAGSIPYSAFWNMCGGFTYSGAVLNNRLHKLYTSISGDNTDYGNYDLLVHIDAAHKDDEYSSYLWLDSNMSLMESPKIYNGDSVEIVQTNFLGWPIKTLTKLSICNSCSVSDKYKEFFEQFFIKNKLNWD